MSRPGCEPGVLTRGRPDYKRDGARLGRRADRCRWTAGRREWGPRMRIDDCSASGSGTPPIGGCGDGRPSLGSGPSGPSSEGGLESGLLTSRTCGPSCTSKTPQTKPPHKRPRPACPTSPSPERVTRTSSGSVTQNTNSANRTQNRGRRSDRSRVLQTRIPSGIVSSDDTATTRFPWLPTLRGYNRPEANSTRCTQRPARVTSRWRRSRQRELRRLRQPEVALR